jgi:hypothetical protein
MRHSEFVIVTRVCLGTIQQRGSKVLNPSLVSFGSTESDFLVRHVQKVRELDEASPRGVFLDLSYVPTQFTALLSCGDLQFEQHCTSLQERLAKSMRGSTAKDCVFAVVHTTDDSGSQITILKLDAIVEAAETDIKAGKVTLRVLQKLIPEPGALQKALSWPDPRSTSDAILIDANFTLAEYFSAAFELGASLKSPDAERALHKTLVRGVSSASLPKILIDAAALEGPADSVLAELSKNYPELKSAAHDAVNEPRPAGLIRKNKLGALPLIWVADGAKLSLPSSKAGSVEILPDPAGQGWMLILRTNSMPVLEN